MNSRAFTLIELLVVVVIISILIGIATPVYTSIMENARKTEALSTINQVKVALNAYQSEYNDWPPSLLTNAPSATEDARIIADTNYTSPGRWQDVFKTLTARGDDSFLQTNNKRRQVFIEFSPKQLDDKTSPTNATTFLDPWGREFNVVADTNGDNLLENLPDPKTGSTNLSINGSIAIWSYGPDDATNIRKYVTSW